MKRLLSNRSLLSLALALFASVISSCALNSSVQELQSLDKDEGVIFGSLMLVADDVKEDESGWAFLRGSKASDLTYGASVKELGLSPFKKTYTLNAKPGKEEIFIRKLDAGTYQFEQLQPTDFMGNGLIIPLGVRFVVTPGQTTYVGKIVVRFPARIMVGTDFHVEVVNTRSETIKGLEGEYGSLVRNAVDGLASR